MQAKKRNLAAKNKSNAKILDLKKSLLKDGEKHTCVFGPKDHTGFKKDKTYHWCPHQIMWCVHTAAKCDKGKGRGVKQKYAKKKKGHGKGGDQEFLALVNYFQGLGPDGDDDDNDNSVTI